MGWHINLQPRSHTWGAGRGVVSSLYPPLLCTKKKNWKGSNRIQMLERLSKWEKRGNRTELSWYNAKITLVFNGKMKLWLSSLFTGVDNHVGLSVAHWQRRSWGKTENYSYAVMPSVTGKMCLLISQWVVMKWQWWNHLSHIRSFCCISGQNQFLAIVAINIINFV